MEQFPFGVATLLPQTDATRPFQIKDLVPLMVQTVINEWYAATMAPAGALASSIARQMRSLQLAFPYEPLGLAGAAIAILAVKPEGESRDSVLNSFPLASVLRSVEAKQMNRYLGMICGVAATTPHPVFSGWMTAPLAGVTQIETTYPTFAKLTAAVSTVSAYSRRNPPPSRSAPKHVTKLLTELLLFFATEVASGDAGFGATFPAAEMAVRMEKARETMPINVGHALNHILEVLSKVKENSQGYADLGQACHILANGLKEML